MNKLVIGLEPQQTRLVPWVQTQRSGSKADRTLREIEVSIPNPIAQRSFSLSGSGAKLLTEIAGEISRLGSLNSNAMGLLAPLLLRHESIASSKIEGLRVSGFELARAQAGIKESPMALEMLRGLEATKRLRESELSQNSLLAAHEILMRDSEDAAWAGKYRDIQNWIEGSDHSPLGASYLPPVPEEIPGLMDDLFAFIARDDMSSLLIAVISHAQFESIHPFTDGNGRIGRALMTKILKTTEPESALIPLSAGLAQAKEEYFQALTDYRAGDVDSLLLLVLKSIRASLGAAVELEKVLLELSASMRSKLGVIRRGSATDLMLEHLLSHPVVQATELAAKFKLGPNSVYSSLERLISAGIIVPVTSRKGNQVWSCPQVFDLLDTFDAEVAQAMRILS